jgi:hypothetical protein
VSKDVLYRQMLTVMQYKEESLKVYFHKKASLCEQCNLEFADAKYAIIEGLTDTSLANTLVAINIPTLRKSGTVSRSMGE